MERLNTDDLLNKINHAKAQNDFANASINNNIVEENAFDVLADEIVKIMAEKMLKNKVKEESHLFRHPVNYWYRTLILEKNQNRLLSALRERLTGEQTKMIVEFSYHHLGIDSGSTYQDSEYVVDWFNITFKIV